MKIAGLILAAGESSRMRSPKALLRIGGVTFAERIAGIMLQQGVEPVFVIAGAHYEEIREAFRSNERFSILHNAWYIQGQISSLKEGLRHLPAGIRAALVWPVDQPLVRPETVGALLNAFADGKSPMAIPTMQGKRGHPVLYGLEAMQTALSLGKDQTAKDLQSIFHDRTLFLEVNDRGVLIDIDTPEEYKQHIGGA